MEVHLIPGLKRLPPKLAANVRRIALMMPTTLLAKIERWRRDQVGLPNQSEAVRRLIEAGLEATTKGDKADKPKPKP
jgi:hypothetical protein